MNCKTLYNQAYNLHLNLTNTAYRRLCHWSIVGYPSDIRTSDDPYLTKLYRIIERAEKRQWRRYLKQKEQAK